VEVVAAGVVAAGAGVVAVGVTTGVVVTAGDVGVVGAPNQYVIPEDAVAFCVFQTEVLAVVAPKTETEIVPAITQPRIRLRIRPPKSCRTPKVVRLLRFRFILSGIHLQ